MPSTELIAEDTTEERVAIRELGPLGDIPLDIEIVLGERMLRLREITAWEAGTVLTLTKPAGEFLDVFVSGEPFGQGEIEVSYTNVGLRISALVW